MYRKSIQHSSPPSSNQALQLNNTSILNRKILLFWLLLTSKNKSCTKSMSFRATNKHSCTKFFAISAIHLSFKRDIRRKTKKLSRIKAFTWFDAKWGSGCDWLWHLHNVFSLFCPIEASSCLYLPYSMGIRLMQCHRTSLLGE